MILEGFPAMSEASWEFLASLEERKNSAEFRQTAVTITSRASAEFLPKFSGGFGEPSWAIEVIFEGFEGPSLWNRLQTDRLLPYGSKVGAEKRFAYTTAAELSSQKTSSRKACP